MKKELLKIEKVTIMKKELLKKHTRKLYEDVSSSIQKFFDAIKNDDLSPTVEELYRALDGALSNVAVDTGLHSYRTDESFANGKYEEYLKNWNYHLKKLH